MSYTVDLPGGPRSRPGPVTVASLLLYVVAFLAVVQGAVGIASFLTTDTNPLQDPNVPADVAQAGTTLGLILSCAFYLLLTVGFVVLAVLVGKGKNPARIVTWVLGGIVVLCCGCGVLLSAVFPSVLSSINDQAARDAFNDVSSSQPGWLQLISMVSSIALVLILIAVIILLMLPASNEYFRREELVWVPPSWPAVADPNYPPYPAPPPVISESAFPPPPPSSPPPAFPPPPFPPPSSPPPPPSSPPPPGENP